MKHLYSLTEAAQKQKTRACTCLVGAWHLTSRVRGLGSPTLLAESPFVLELTLQVTVENGGFSL